MPPIESRSIDVNLYGQDDHKKYKKPPIRLPKQQRNESLPSIDGSSRFSDSHSKYQSSQHTNSVIYKNSVKQKMMIDAQRGSRRSMKHERP